MCSKYLLTALCMIKPMYKIAIMKTLLLILFFCSACLSTSFHKDKNTGGKVKRTTISIQDNMNPLNPFIF